MHYFATHTDTFRFAADEIKQTMFIKHRYIAGVKPQVALLSSISYVMLKKYSS